MRFDQRKRMVAYTADEKQQIRGDSAVIAPAPMRHLKVVKPPRRKPLDRTVYDGQGNVHPRFKRTRIARKPNQIIVVQPPTPKSHKRYAGAEYGETWQTSHSVHTDTAPEREYWFRGVKYESQAAIEAYIASL